MVQHLFELIFALHGLVLMLRRVFPNMLCLHIGLVHQLVVCRYSGGSHFWIISEKSTEQSIQGVVDARHWSDAWEPRRLLGSK